MQKRDNARALTRLDSLVCLKQVTIMIVMVVMVVMIMPTLLQLLEDDSSMLTSHALWVMGTACRHEPDVQVLLLLLLLLLPFLLSTPLSPAAAAHERARHHIVPCLPPTIIPRLRIRRPLRRWRTRRRQVAVSDS